MTGRRGAGGVFRACGIAGDADAFVLDKEHGVLADPAKVHYAELPGPLDQVARPAVDPAQPAGGTR